MIRLIGIDVDHTLLRSDGTVSPETKSTIAEAVERGVKVSITSGRLPAEVRPIQAMAGCEGQSLIGCNGAYMVMAEREEEQIRCLPGPQALRILDYAQREGLNCHGFRPDRVYSSAESTRSRFLLWKENLDKWGVAAECREPLEFLREDEPLLKIVFIEDDPEKLEQAREYVASLGGLSIASSWKSNIEIMEAAANKGSALLALGEMLGIAPEEVMAIGDNENDIPMLRAAGLSVAMGNATEAAKEAAIHETAHNDADGVALAIRRHVLEA